VIFLAGGPNDSKCPHDGREQRLILSMRDTSTCANVYEGAAGQPNAFVAVAVRFREAFEDLIFD